MHQNSNQNKNKQHIPILLSEVLTYLEPKEGDSYLDLTAGYGGHAKAILERTGSLTNSVLVDRDINAIMELEKAFEPNTVSIRIFYLLPRNCWMITGSSILFWRI
jgi:16S rRNA C1402 N4-methylase RsmH